MKLTSRDGAEVALRPIRYEFPSATGGSDADWLVIRGDVMLADGRAWSFEEPCLEVEDARSLGGWLGEVMSGTVSQSDFETAGTSDLLSFTEPNLGSSLKGQSTEIIALRVHLSLESLPPWVPREARPGIYDYFIVLEVPRGHLTLAIDDWREDLAYFPER